MKILVLGATGATGSRLVERALVKGHFVTAAVRDPMKLDLVHDRLTIIRLDILDQAALQVAIGVQDAVLSALGPGRDLHSNIVSLAVKEIIPAMERTSVRRLIFLSSFGAGDTWEQASVLSKMVFSMLFKDVLKDKSVADDLLRSSSLDYTLVYPTSLTNGPLTGEYRVGAELRPGLIPNISRADVADFMLSQLTDTAWIRKTVIITG